MSYLSKFLYRIDSPSYNLWRSLIINFSILPFKQAVRLPIAIYGKVRFFSLEGSATIEGPLSFGMIKIGVNITYFTGSLNSGLFALMKEAKIIFKGKCSFDIGCVLRIANGIFEIGDNVYFGSEIKIFVDKKIVIKDNVRLALQCLIQDSNFHFTLNKDKKIIKNCCRPIFIGENCWVGNRTNIMPGTVLPSFTIVGSKSLLNKNYTCDYNNILLAGTPAKVVGTNIVRIWNPDFEAYLRAYFNENDTDYILKAGDCYYE